MIGHVNQVESTGCWHIPRLKTKCLIRIRIFDIHICVWKLETKVVGNVLLPRLWGKETAEQPIDWWLKETNLSMLFIICPARSHLLILWFGDTLEESEVLHVETVNGFLKKQQHLVKLFEETNHLEPPAPAFGLRNINTYHYHWINYIWRVYTGNPTFSEETNIF